MACSSLPAEPGQDASRELRAKWQADDRDAFAAQEERRSSWRRAKRGGVVAFGVVAGKWRATWIGFAVQFGRRRCVACVEILVQQARTPIMSSTHGHAFLELCCALDSELAAGVVEHSVVIRVTSFEDFQLTSTRPALHRLLMIYKAY